MTDARTLDLGSGVCSFGRSFWALTILCAVLYLPGLNLLPPIDRDEARFMQATKQMIETGDYAHIRFQAEPRDKKPIGAHWAQAASVNVFAQRLTEAWAYRLPSALGVWLAVIAVAYGLGGATGLAAGAILATSLLSVAEAHLAKADGLLLGVSAIVFASLMRAYSAPQNQPLPCGVAIAFWAALGMSVLIKGPILPLIVLLALLALLGLDRTLAWMAQLKPLMGVPIMLAIIAIWPAIVGWDEVLRFTAAAMAQDLLPKLQRGMESHGAPPGTHTLLAFGTLWPWGFLLPVAIMATWRTRTSALIKLCAAWIIPFWLVLELTPTKLPHYPLPVFPAVVVLIALALRSWPLGRVFSFGAIGVIVALGLLTAGLTVIKPAMLRWDDLWVSSRLTAAIAPHRAADTPVILVGYSEPSAVFLLGTKTITTNPEHAAALLAATPNAIAAIDDRELVLFDQFLASHGHTAQPIDIVTGYNYSTGAPVRLNIIMRLNILKSRANSGL